MHSTNITTIASASRLTKHTLCRGTGGCRLSARSLRIGENARFAGRWLVRVARSALLLATANCAQPGVTASVTIPPIREGEARIWFYRDYEPYAGKGLPAVSDERELIRRAEPGDDGARNRLWEAFFPFAMAECRKQAELTNLDPDIAEGEAALAIPEAIIRFDLRRHKRFSTYLAHRLRGAITAARREHLRSSIFDKAEYFPDKQRATLLSGASPDRARRSGSARRARC
jgi:hypothetical protein